MNFLSMMDLIFIFENTSVDRASIIGGLLTRVKNLSSSSKTFNANMSLLERLNIFISVLKSIK